MNWTALEIIEKRKKLWEESHNISEDNEFVESVCDYLIDKKDGKNLRNEIIEHPDYLIEMAFIIVDKELKTVPFFLNAVQCKFRDELVQAIKDYEAGVRLDLKFLILKGRQQGFTSWISAYQLALTITKKNFKGMTLADSSENTETIFEEKGKFIYDRLPLALQPVEAINNRRELSFERLNSKWRVATAGNKDVGRSKTLSFFHGSESGFWTSIRGIFLGLGNALTDKAIQILESTANGINEFKDLWDEDNNWQPCFFEWWLSPEYKKRFEDGSREKWFSRKLKESKNKSWNDSNDEVWIYYRCKTLVEDRKLSLNQVYWYYNKWKDIKGDIRQEFPCFPDEAFIASGSCVYKNVEAIVERIADLTKIYKENPPKTGYFEIIWMDEKAKYKILDYRWVNDPEGYIIIYEEPEIGYPYIIGGDTKGAGQGIVKDRDSYTASVKNNATGTRCAELECNYILPDEYAAQMYCLGKYYNYALLAIEVNIDQYPIMKLRELGYSNQYVRRTEDTFTGAIKKAFGWRTDGNNRPKIISRHIILVNTCIEKFPSIKMLKQMLTFVKTDIRYDHQSGTHDDLLFGDFIGEEASLTAPHEIIENPKPKKKRLIDQLQLNNKKLGR